MKEKELLKYQITASSISNNDATIHIKQSEIDFGTTPETTEELPSPADLYLGAFSACMLKNVERFSGMMHFTYTKASVDVKATRLENPPRMDQIDYKLTIYSNDPKLNKDLLKRNIEKFGTIYNTVKQACSISGSIETVDNV